MEIKGTQSEKNIIAAFAGESQARNKYTYFALQAREQGNDEIADIFEKMANNECEHAKIWFKLLHDGLGDIESNLQNAAEGENYEWKSMYPEFAAEAREEGLEMLAVMFERVAAIENYHEKKFLETYLQFTSKIKAEKEKTPYEPLNFTNQENNHQYACMFCGDQEEDHLDVCPVCEAIGAFEYIA